MLRLKDLRKKRNLSLRQLANDLSISFSSLNKYENHEQQPSIDTLIKLAEYFDVSVDYLIGYSDISTKNVEDKVIAERTGLTLPAIELLSSYQMNAAKIPTDAFDTTPAFSSLFLSTMNKLLHPSCDILTNITNYLYLQLDYFYDDDTYSDEDLYKHISELGLFDKRLGISYNNDYDYLSQIFLLMIQEDLIRLRNEVQYNIPKRITPITEETHVYYSQHPNLCMETIKKLISAPFCSYLENAIITHKRINYKDRYPRLIIDDVSINRNSLTFFFSDGSNDSISFNEYKIDQSSSIPFEFYFSKPNNDYFIIIFET